MSAKLPGRILLLCLFVVSIPPGAMAATRYVETYGDNDSGNNDCRSKSVPCNTIQRAIDAAGDNDSILVGPGTYPDYLVVTKRGLKLRSVAGAHGTVIDPSGSPASIGVHLTMDKIVFGQKKKGFTILAGSTTESPLYSEGLSNRIEGNRIINPNDLDVTAVRAMQVRGAGSSVRYNEINAGDTSYFQYGILADVGSYMDTAAKMQLTENSVRGANTCIYLFGWNNNGSKSSGNRLHRCHYIGLYAHNANTSNPSVPAPSSKDKHQGNMVLLGDQVNLEAAGFYVFGGNPQLRKNLADLRANNSTSNSGGFWLESLNKASIKDNHVFGDAASESYGIWAFDLGSGGTPGITISANTFVTLDHGVRILPDDLGSFSRNNLLDIATCPLYFDAPLTGSFTMKKDFWGDESGPTLGSCPADTTNAAGNNLTIDHSTKLNPVKFKSPI